MSDRAKDAIRHGYDPPKQASIVRDHFRRKQRARASRAIADILRRELYKAQSWRGSDYADSIALLCREWLVDHERIVVVTTNFDQYLELAFYQISLDQRTTEGVGSYSVDQESGTQLARPDAPVSIVHIHGVVPEPSPPLDDDTQDEIVLDEGCPFRGDRRVGIVR